MSFEPATDQMLRANEANWDARAPVHAASEFYGVGRKDPRFWFAPFEWADLGDLTGRSVLHLQCHLGTETIAFARQGAAPVCGLDFSAESLAHARRIAERAVAPIEYVRSDVHDAVAALGGRQFDVVYTGKGALCYLPDLARWAAVVASLLPHGGLLYLVEFHPVLTSLRPKPAAGAGPELTLVDDYLAGRGALRRDATYTYTDGPPLVAATTAYEWAHGLGEVVNALIGAGLVISRLRESELLPWPRWQRMVRTDEGWWRLPDEDPRIPLLYALTATKP